MEASKIKGAEKKRILAAWTGRMQGMPIPVENAALRLCVRFTVPSMTFHMLR